MEEGGQEYFRRANDRWLPALATRLLRPISEVGNRLFAYDRPRVEALCFEANETFAKRISE